MKKTYLFLILTFLVIPKLFAQRITSDSPEEMQKIAVASKKTVLDTCVLSAQYRMFSVNDIEKPEVKKNNFMLLQIGKRISKFSDYYKLVGDSLQDVYAAEKMNMMESVNKLLPLLKGTTPLKVFKNYPTGKITVIDRIPLSGNYKYIEEKEKPLWELATGTLTVCGYQCKRATTTFRGRNYTAWYAPEIAVDEGPWKFWGLPGLILKVGDDAGHYSFECIAIEKAREITSIYILDRSYMTITKDKLNQALKDFNANPSGNVINSGLVKGELPATAYKSRPYNPIELSD